MTKRKDSIDALTPTQAREALREMRRRLFAMVNRKDLTIADANALLANNAFDNFRIMRLVACPGHAHSPEVSGMQDHCAVCSPQWGVVEES